MWYKIKQYHAFTNGRSRPLQATTTAATTMTITSWDDVSMHYQIIYLFHCFFFILWPTRLIMSRVVSAAMASMCFPGKMLQIPLGFFTLLIKHKHIMILETFISPKCWTLLKTQLRQRLTICSRCCCCCYSSSSCHKRIDNLNFLSFCTHYALSRRV